MGALARWRRARAHAPERASDAATAAHEAAGPRRQRPLTATRVVGRIDDTPIAVVKLAENDAELALEVLGSAEPMSLVTPVSGDVSLMMHADPFRGGDFYDQAGVPLYS